MPQLPSWYPGEENKAAPMPLLLVQAFLNTRDLEQRSDLLDDPATAGRWLADAGLLCPGYELRHQELELARQVRESIRDLLEGEGPADLEPLRVVTEGRTATLAIEEGGVLTVRNPRTEDLRDALFELLLVVRAAQEDGSWTRLKVCANDECRWAFYDRSRNQQGNWCSMAVCGNRLKNRRYRRRPVP